MNINAPNGVTAAKEITLEAGIGNINIEGDSTIKGTDVTIHTATGNVTSGKNTTVEATTDNILVDASLRADMLGTLKAENGSVTVKAGLGATAGTVIAKDANIEANTGDIILEEDVTAGDINLDAKRGYVITKSLTATDDSITVNAGIDATLNGNLTAENGDVSVTAKNNAAITGTSKNGKPIMHLSRLGEVCRRDQIKIGIITVPAEQAQSVCDLLISNGILAIWNFAPKHLNVPDHILVQNENMAASLALLCKHLNEQMKSEE